MRVPVVNIRVVGVAVHHALMRVGVRVRLAAVTLEVVLVAMMFVVAVRV